MTGKAAASADVLRSRVVVVCGESYRHRYFAQRLARSCNVVGVVTERMGPHLGMGFVHRSLELARGFKYRPNRIYAKAYCRLLELSRGRGVYERILGPIEPGFGSGVEHVALESSINLPANRERLRRLEPDVLAVSGARLLSREVIETPRLAAINMHGGLSPYYRGAESVFWALHNGEPQYVGVTIHLLTTGIDAGPIVYTDRPRIDAADTEMTLFAKAYGLGCDLMARAVEDVEAGRLRSVPQWTKGRLYRRGDRKPRHYRAMIRTLQGGLLDDYLRRGGEREGGVRLVGDPRPEPPIAAGLEPGRERPSSAR